MKWSIANLLLAVLLAPGLLTAQSQGRATATAPSSSGAGRLSLREAVAIALKNNPSIEAANAYSEAVRHGIAIAQAGRYPRLDFSEGFTRGNNPVYVFGSLLTQRQFTARNFDLGLLNVPSPLDNFRTQFSATVPLFDAGRVSRRVGDARLDAQSAEQSIHRTRQEVIFNVISAYSNELLARESVRVAQASAGMTASDLSLAKAREAQGLAVASDVLSAQVQLAQAKEDLIRARNAAEFAHAALNAAMGLPEDAPTEIQGTLAEVEFQPGTLTELDAGALENRPDYRRMLNAKEKAANAIRSARAEYLPTVSLFSAWEADNQTFAARGGNNWALGATLNFNLFEGGARRAQVAMSRAKARQAEAQQAELASAIQLQVREAFLNLDAAHQREEVSRDAAAQARESLRILRNRYEAGLVTITDLLRAETALTQAQRSFLNAIFDYRLAFAALELATGELGPASAAVVK